MKVKKRLLENLKKAQEEEFDRMVNTINNVLIQIEKENIRTDKELLRQMNNRIIELGNDIVKAMEKADIVKLESLMFEQNVLNEYYSEFKTKKHRPIYYERELDGFINTKLDDGDGESLTFKVKNQK